MDGLDEDAADRLDNAFRDARVPFLRPPSDSDVIALPVR